MKKILSIAAVLILLIALAAPAFAEEGTESVGADDLVLVISESSESPSEGEIGEDNSLLGVWDVYLVHEETGEPATEEEIAAYLEEHGGTITIDFSAVAGNANLEKILHLYDGTWNNEAFSGMTVNADQLGSFALIVREVGTLPGGPVQSPQTGYNTSVWALAAVAMAICAGFCIVRVRKTED